MNVSRQKLLTKLGQWRNDGEWTRFYEMVDELIPVYNEYAYSVRDEIIYYNKDDELNEMLQRLSPSEVLLKVHNGKYSYGDPYVTFDGYANLKSMTEVEVYELYLTDPGFEKWYISDEE
jgi:hypothetical protein